jgi:hypothetical protein
MKSLIFLVLSCCSRSGDLLENSVTDTPRLSCAVIHGNHPLSHHECEYQSYGTDDSLCPEQADILYQSKQVQFVHIRREIVYGCQQGYVHARDPFIAYREDD